LASFSERGEAAFKKLNAAAGQIAWCFSLPASLQKISAGHWVRSRRCASLGNEFKIHPNGLMT
jgi:hypothetical protein